MTGSPGRLGRVVVALVALASACTYGPPETRSVIGQVVRVGDSHQALVVISYERARPPRGPSTFPDGGKTKVLERRGRLYLVDASRRTVSLLMDRAAPDSLWQSFRLSVRGLDGDSAAYVQMTGCPRGGECHPDLSRSATFRVTRRGDVDSVRDVPAGAGLPGVMLARRPGEGSYVRFGTDGAFVTARLGERAPWTHVFVVDDDGTLSPVGS